MLEGIMIIGPFSDPLSVQILQICMLIFFTGMFAGEVGGTGRLRYSKFASTDRGAVVPSKVGMAAMYVPSCLLSFAFLVLKLTHSPLIPAVSNRRLLLFTASLAIHFLKRVLEVLFLHKFSGSVEVFMSAFISSAYLTACGIMLYAQQRAAERDPPGVDLMWWGLGLFLVGITGNFYHHYLLANLRSDEKPESKRKYVIPQGGLFNWVVCPHYLFECIGFFGIALIGQTSSALIAAIGMTASLCARSYNTKAWYLKKIEGFPAHRKPFFPFLF